jgi:hypothetical protein
VSSDEGQHKRRGRDEQDRLQDRQGVARRRRELELNLSEGFSTRESCQIEPHNLRAVATVHKNSLTIQTRAKTFNLRLDQLLPDRVGN